MDDLKFNETVEKYSTTTPGHADEFNKRQDKLLENDKYLESHLRDIKNLTGDKKDLKTTNKDNLVDAINETFQSGVNTKKQAVSILTSLGIKELTVNSDWKTILNNIKEVKKKLKVLNLIKTDKYLSNLDDKYLYFVTRNTVEKYNWNDELIEELQLSLENREWIWCVDSQNIFTIQNNYDNKTKILRKRNKNNDLLIEVSLESSFFLERDGGFFYENTLALPVKGEGETWEYQVFDYNLRFIKKITNVKEKLASLINYKNIVWTMKYNKYTVVNEKLEAIKELLSANVGLSYLINGGAIEE